MSIYEIRVIAKSVGIDPREKNKTDLIKTIQLKKGNTACFKTAGINCDQPDCFWQSDCQK